jgi:hypothetical protein
MKSKFGGVKAGMGALAGGALAAGAALAGAAVVAWDLATAAAEDADQADQLAGALKRVTGATDEQVAAVEALITKLSLATGIADSELRPAFQRLASSTGSLEAATELLGLAMDIAAQTGKPLATVAAALGKASQGSSGPLSKLTGIMLDGGKNAGAWNRNQKLLNDKFGGAAAEKANTYGGKAQRIANAFGEAQEALGEKLLPYLEDFADWISSPEGGKALEDLSKGAGDLAEELGKAADAIATFWSYVQKVDSFVPDGFLWKFRADPDDYWPDRWPWETRASGSASVGATARSVNITVNGAVDPSSTARQVRALLGNDTMRGGYVRQRQL